MKSDESMKAKNARPARPADLRETNAREVLRLVQEHTPCSKADLVRLSGLSAPSVSSTVERLLKRGMVRAEGEGESSGGRPPQMLSFAAKRGYVAAADIGGTRLRVMVADLNGEPMARWSTLMKRKDKTPAGMCELMGRALAEVCRIAGVRMKKVLHLTVGAPGITNAGNGVVVAAPNLLGWNDVPLRTMLEAALGIECLVENDVNLAAVGEHRRGVAKGINDFVFIAVGTGLGAGVFLRGEVYHGARWTAGELGYLGVRHRVAEPLRLREMGQMEDVIGGEGIERCWRQVLPQQPRYDPARLKMRAPAILDCAGRGDAVAEQVLQQTARVLAEAITSVALVIDPEMVVLGGGVGSHPAICPAVERLLAENEFAKPRVKASTLGTEAQLFGGVALSQRATEANRLQ